MGGSTLNQFLRRAPHSLKAEIVGGEIDDLLRSRCISLRDGYAVQVQVNDRGDSLLF
jgi:hypothetical protein